MRAIRDEGAHVGRTYGETKDPKGTTFLSSYARTLTNGGLRFHTDRTDVVGLLCVRQARAGGVSKLASTPAIHNAILARRPDLLDELFKDYWRSRFGEEGTTKETAYPLPIFGLRDGKFTSHYSLTFIEAAEMAPGVPKLTPAQKEAIEVLMATAEELCFEMTLEPGDLQLINSHVTYHGRTPFEDDFAAGQEPPAAAAVAHHAQQPAAARGSRDPVAQHRGQHATRRHSAGDALTVAPGAR